MTSKIKYIGNLRCESVHLQSGNEIITDAPTDNHGQGAAFSPTDLCATSLGQCMLTTIAILGKDKGINIDGAICDVQKNMNPKPRKIAEIMLDIHIPGDFTDEQKEFIKDTGLNCPVALSLHPDVKKTVSFKFG
ncbi:MAG: OsmC family peroxiredoxin [Chryseobacterium sp.]|nr:MAG: OsmC family peroxiredoxin [Chryseobacterium sp.]